MNKPIISVVLPVYNEEKFIGECIESILNQTYRDFELIIINDASTDGSVGIINNFLDSRIVLIHNNNNLGIAKSLNRGFEKAKGEFIARIDANDIAVETRFEKQIEYLINHPQCAVVFCPVFKIDESGNIIKGLSGKYISQEFIQTRMFYKNCFYHSAAIMRKTSLPNPPYDESSFAEDYNLWVDLSIKWELHVIDEVLMKVRDLPEGLRYQPECENSAKQVRLKQLEWLHIYPTRMELNIHLGLVSKNYKIDPVYVKEKLEWLDKVYLANEKHCVFREPFFTNKLVEHWLSFVNYLDSPITIPLFLLILKSPLRKKTKKSIIRIIIKYFPYIRLRYYSNIGKIFLVFIEKTMVKYLIYFNQDILKDNKIWWRDDDSFEVNDRFLDLINFQKKRNINVYLSIIPSKITKEFIQNVNNTNGAYVFLHGYAHINYSDDIGKLNEYPETRDSDQISYEISESVKKLKVNFPSKYLPVFVPPWEHYSAKLLAILPKYGLHTISLSGFYADLPKTLLQLNVQINFHTYKNISPDRHIVYRKKLLSICKEIISVAKNNRSNGKIGFVTHHNDMNKDDWNNYYFILSELNKVGCQELSCNEMRSIISERN